MRTLDTARFRDADKYLSYLNTRSGRLRSELALENLRGFLPSQGYRLRVLDLGGGTGFASIRLARMEFEVVLLDSSEEMLGIARMEAEANGVDAKIVFCQADAAQVCRLFEAESFDIVVCHNLLEYVADPRAILRSLGKIVRQNAVVSILVRNRAGEVLRAAIKLGDFGLARTNLTAETVTDSLFDEPVRVFDPTDLSLAQADQGLGIVAEYGVRVFSDYVDTDLNADTYRQLFELESILGAQPKFAAIARYSQLIARRSSASASQGTTG